MRKQQEIKKLRDICFFLCMFPYHDSSKLSWDPMGVTIACCAAEGLWVAVCTLMKFAVPHLQLRTT